MNNPIVELKPCPFCGGKASCDTSVCDMPPPYRYSVVCVSNKPCAGAAYRTDFDWPTPEEAIAAWNHRALPDKAGEAVVKYPDDFDCGMTALPKAEPVAWIGKDVITDAMRKAGSECFSPFPKRGDEINAERIYLAMRNAAPAAPVVEGREEAREVVRFLERITDDDCGCRPCRGQCRSEASLRIWKDNVQDQAAALLAKAYGLEVKDEMQSSDGNPPPIY